MNTYLVERNVEVKNISKEQFINAMVEDITNAVNIYQKMVDTYNENAEREYTERNLERFYREAEKLFAKFKRESTRQRKTETYVTEMMSKYNRFCKERGITYFDFDCEPGTNGISGYCVISVDNMTENLPHTFEYLKDNKYFKNAIGWKLGYINSSNGNGLCSFRPQIYLTLPIEFEIKFKAEQKSLSDAIARFYSNSNYWGD
jgi:hypothetical protein